MTDPGEYLTQPEKAEPMVEHTAGCERPTGEAQRREAFHRVAYVMPPMDMSGWVWTQEETEILRRACAVRFDESLRTESLFSVAAAAMRILLWRQARAKSLEPCPICGGIEGCDHTVRERELASARAFVAKAQGGEL